ncbi:CYP302A1 family protein [Megaselia abdita]
MKKKVLFLSKSLKSVSTLNYSTSAGKLKKFDDIPGPRGPFGLGNLYNYMPIIGKYSWLELHKSGLDKYETYGEIVRETMAPGVDIVWLYNPNDIATVLNEKEHPQRRSHLALEKYRKDRPHIYKTGGLLPTNGQEWWRLRSELQKELSVPKNVRSFLMDVDDITNEFVNHLESDIVINMLPELARLNLELTCLLTFDVRLNSFSIEEKHPNSKTSRLIRATETTNSCILPTDQGLQLWRKFETPTYKRLRRAQNFMENVAIDLISEKISYYREDRQQQFSAGYMKRSSLIDEYLKNPNLDLSDIVGVGNDLMLAGVDTTSYTSSFVLYYLGRYPEVQKKVFEEAKKFMKEKYAPIEGDALRTDIPYTRAVLKEVFRLNPISVGIGRILNKDTVFSSYEVPKGVSVFLYTKIIYNILFFVSFNCCVSIRSNILGLVLHR